MTIGHLEYLRYSKRYAQADGDVACNQVAPDRQDYCLPDSSVGKHGDIRGSPTNIDQYHPKLGLTIR